MQDSFKRLRPAAHRCPRRAWLGCLAAVLLLANVAAAKPPPTRIVSLTPSVTETIFALGLGERVVAVSDFCDVPAAATRLPRVGSFLAPVVERVVALQPDLVITSPTPGNRGAVGALERAGVPVVVVAEGSASVAETRESIRAVARAAGALDAGERLVRALDARLARVAERVRGRRPPRTIVAVGFEPFVLAGPESYLGELVEIAGGTNVAAAVGGKWPRTGWEFLVASDIEVIIDLAAAMGIDAGSARARWSRFAAIPAVAAGRVSVLASSALVRPGPRIGEAAEELARVLHPDVWNDAN